MEKDYSKNNVEKDKHTQELLLNYSQQKYFVNQFRPISINNYNFYLDSGCNSNRVNVKYFSDDFELILEQYKYK